MSWGKEGHSWQSEVGRADLTSGENNNPISSQQSQDSARRSMGPAPDQCWLGSECVPAEFRCWKLDPQIHVLFGGGAFGRTLGSGRVLRLP